MMPSRDKACTVSLRVKPNAKKNDLQWADDTITARITSAPVEGKANNQVVKILSKALHVPKSAITIVRGHTCRNKVIAIDGVGVDDIRRCIAQTQK